MSQATALQLVLLALVQRLGNPYQTYAVASRINFLVRHVVEMCLVAMLAVVLFPKPVRAEADEKTISVTVEDHVTAADLVLATFRKRYPITVREVLRVKVLDTDSMRVCEIVLDGVTGRPVCPDEIEREFRAPRRRARGASDSTVPDEINARQPDEDAGEDEGGEGSVVGSVLGGMLGGVVGGMLDQPLYAGIGGVTSPELIPGSKTKPTYPEIARKAKVSGQVILQAVVRKDGTVGDVQVLRSPGSKCGFDEAAMAAVRQWRYKPGLQSGKPVGVYFTIVVDFVLK